MVRKQKEEPKVERSSNSQRSRELRANEHRNLAWLKDQLSKEGKLVFERILGQLINTQVFLFSFNDSIKFSKEMEAVVEAIDSNKVDHISSLVTKLIPTIKKSKITEPIVISVRPVIETAEKKLNEGNDLAYNTELNETEVQVTKKTNTQAKISEHIRALSELLEVPQEELERRVTAKSEPQTEAPAKPVIGEHTARVESENIPPLPSKEDRPRWATRPNKDTEAYTPKDFIAEHFSDNLGADVPKEKRVTRSWLNGDRALYNALGNWETGGGQLPSDWDMAPQQSESSARAAELERTGGEGMSYEDKLKAQRAKASKEYRARQRKM